MPIQKVSVVIPARNEEATIGPVLDELNGAIARLPRYRFETLVVVDNPQDPTIGMAQVKGFDCEIEIAARAIRQGYPLVEVATHENKRAGGKMKSRAFRDGFAIMLAVLREGLAYRAWRLFHWRRWKEFTR